MKPLFKNALYGTVGLAVLSAFVFGKDVCSYARTSARSVQKAVKAEVPLEFQIERAHEMVEGLIPDIRHHMEVIAEDQVEVEHLTNEIARKSDEMGRQKQAILTLKSDLDSGNGTFVYASRTYTSAEVIHDLEDRFERYKAAEEALERDEKILDARRKALHANEDRLDKMLLAKKDMEVKVEQLEARLKSLQAAQVVSTINIDDSRLARLKDLVQELDKQLDVKVKMLDADGKFAGMIPVETEPKVTEIPVNVTEEIDAYFGTDKQDESRDVAEVTEPTL